jgi:peptidoglycan/LPS O-acetylase OafA/YrhL
MHIPFARWGGFGVDIFFVVSGFIMCYIASFDDRNFLLKRIFRIVPVYWLGTLGAYCLATFFPRLLPSTSSHWGDLLKSLFFIPYMRADHSIRPVLFLGWTLEYEVFFYLVFAAALAFPRRKSATGAGWRDFLLAVLLLGAIVTLGQIFKPASTILRFYTGPVILEFAFGAGVFLLWKQRRALLVRTPLALALMLSVLAYTTFLMFDLKILNSHAAYLRHIPGVVIRGVLAFLLCTSFLSMEGKVRFPKCWLRIGDASYSLYVFHPYVVGLIDRGLVSLQFLTPLTLAFGLLAILGCLAVAIISFDLFERPLNEFLRRKFLKRAGRAVTTTA